MPRCKICGEWFIGGNPKDDDDICLYCYLKSWAKNTIAEIKQKH